MNGQIIAQAVHYLKQCEDSLMHSRYTFPPSNATTVNEPSMSMIVQKLYEESRRADAEAIGLRLFDSLGGLHICVAAELVSNKPDYRLPLLIFTLPNLFDATTYWICFINALAAVSPVKEMDGNDILVNSVRLYMTKSYEAITRNDSTETGHKRKKAKTHHNMDLCRVVSFVNFPSFSEAKEFFSKDDIHKRFSRLTNVQTKSMYMAFYCVNDFPVKVLNAFETLGFPDVKQRFGSQIFRQREAAKYHLDRNDKEGIVRFMLGLGDIGDEKNRQAAEQQQQSSVVFDS
jgi:hypothetical protein